MKKSGKNQGKSTRLINISRTWSRFFFGRETTQDDRADESSGWEDRLFKNGIFGSLCEVVAKKSEAITDFCGSYVQQSRVINAFSLFFRGLLNTSVGSLGVFLFFVGLYSAAVCLVQMYAGDPADILRLIYSGVIAFMGLVLMPVKRSILGSVRRGGLLSYIARELLGISEYALDTEKPGRRHTAWAVLFGTLVGVAGFFVSPVTIIVLAAAISLTAVVIYSPESGLYLAAFMFPFADFKIPTAVMLVSGVGYVIKLLIRKRNFYFSGADIFVGMFGICFYLVSVFTPFGFENTGTAVFAVALMYILSVNLIRSGEMLQRILTAVNSGALILAFCVIYAHFFGNELGGFGKLLVSVGQNRGMLPLLLPAALSVMFSKGLFSSGTVSVLAVCTAIALSYSPWIYVSSVAIITLCFMLTFSKRKHIFTAGLLVCGIIAAVFALGFLESRAGWHVTSDTASFTAVDKYLLFGVGAGKTPFVYGFRGVGYSFTAPSDMYSAVIIAGGAGLLLLMIFAGSAVIRKGLKALDARRNSFGFRCPAGGITATAVAVATYGAISGAWVNLGVIAMLSMAAGCINGLPRIYEREVGDEYEEYK